MPRKIPNKHLPRAHLRPDLAQTLANPQNAIDQQPVGRALDLEVAEECVCAEQAEHLVERIVGFRIGFGGQVGGQRRVQRKRVGRPTDLGAEGEEGEVPD
jgi:hypothetical protein